MIRIGLVAAEASGDNLAAGLIQTLKSKLDDVVVEGVGGEQLSKTGMKILYPMERLSVMGFTEVLGRYWELKKMRDALIEYFICDPPDIFIGVDAPDFNLGLEQALKKAGIKTVHYVSPSIYAWREYRIKNIKKSADLVLNLFPFESKIYRQHGIANKFVGHPLADKIERKFDLIEKRKALSLPVEQQIIALLPGSRLSEIKKITKPLLQAALLVNKRNNNLRFISGFVNQQSLNLFNRIKNQVAADLHIETFIGNTHDVIAASNIIVLASGTVALEAMLFNKPMIVVYRVSLLSYLIIKLLVKIPNVSLPNVLAGKKIVPEYLQYQCTAKNIASELNCLLDSNEERMNMEKKFLHLSEQLKKGANKQATEAVLALVNRNSNA